MLRYILGWLSGACSLFLGMHCILNPENLCVSLIMIVGINLIAGSWAYNHHKKKQQAYYDRFNQVR